MNVKLTSNAKATEAVLLRYIAVSGKSMEETIIRQGQKISFELSKLLKAEAPEKEKLRDAGRIIDQRGGLIIGEHIRKRIYQKYGVRTNIASRGLVFGKSRNRKTGQAIDKTEVTRKGQRVNLQQLLVEAEINSRVQGIGFASVSARYRVKRGTEKKKSRFGPAISALSVKFQKDNYSFELSWSPENGYQEDIAQFLNTGKGQAVIEKAMEAARQDTLIYVERKEKENLEKSLAKLN